MSARLAHALLAVLLVAAPLAACGKAGAPGLPAGEKSTYPHPYPTGATQNATPSVPGGQPVPADTTGPVPPVPPNVLPTNPPTTNDTSPE